MLRIQPKVRTQNVVKLGIGFPCNYAHVPSAFFENIMTLRKPNFEFILAEIGNIDAMRNYIVETALSAGCTHLIMMDTDMLYHEDTIYRLLSHNLPIVGALCYRRRPPFDPLMMKGKPGDYKCIDEWQESALVEVDATGTGCLLFDMEVFKAMPRPWFKFEVNDEGQPIGEDIGFCYDLRQTGYKIYVDTTIPAGHLSTMVVTDETYRWWKALRTRQYIEERRKRADIK